MEGPLFYLHLVVKPRTAASSGSLPRPRPAPFSICQTFLCLSPQSGSWLIEFAPPFHLCGFQVPALLRDRTKALFTWLALPSVKRYLPACLAVEMSVVCGGYQNGGDGTHMCKVVGWLHLELPGFIRTRGIGYSKMWAKSLGWIKHATSHKDLLVVPL